MQAQPRRFRDPRLLAAGEDSLERAGAKEPGGDGVVEDLGGSVKALVDHAQGRGAQGGPARAARLARAQAAARVNRP